MPIRTLIIHGTLTSTALLTGCAGIQQSPGFTDVQALAATHGVARIHWNQGTSEDAAVLTAIRQMLTDEVTIDEAVQIALLKNRNLQSTFETLRIAQADLVQAGLLKNPVFDGSIRFVGSGGSDVIDAGIAFDFLDVFFIPMRKRIAEQQFESQKLQVTGSVIDLAGQVKVTFFKLQAAEQLLEMRRTSLASFEASYDFAKRVRAAGNNTLLRVAREQTVYEEAKLGLNAAEEEVLSLHEELNVLMGLFGEAGKWKTATRLPDVPDAAFPSTRLESVALERSLDLKVARGGIELAAKRLGITKPLGLLSNLEAGITSERDGDWSLGPAVSLPIPIFTRGQPAIAKADAELRQSLNTYYSTAIEIRSGVRAAHTRMQAARSRVQHLKAVVLPLRQLVVDETQKEYNAMLVGAFELLQARRDQVDAGKQYIEALRDYWIARSQLEQTAGGRMVRGGLAPVSTSSDSPSNNTGGH